MKNSSIQWCDHAHNPWLGCRKVAPECEKCYIVRQTPLRVRGIKHGSTRHRCSAATLKQPLIWNRAAEGLAERPRVFCLSLGDWLDNEVPIEWFADLMEMQLKCDNLDFLFLTKRPQNWEKRIKGAIHYLESVALKHDNELSRTMLDLWMNHNRPPHNVWIGVSAGADQRAALDIPAKIHFLSCEPMLHQLDTRWSAQFDWIIFGGESEPGGEPRSTALEWIYDGLEFCERNDIAAFVKQLGGRPTQYDRVIPVSTAHGDNMEEWPEALRIRQFPILSNVNETTTARTTDRA